jgi:hypothetical protein
MAILFTETLSTQRRSHFHGRAWGTCGAYTEADTAEAAGSAPCCCCWWWFYFMLSCNQGCMLPCFE